MRLHVRQGGRIAARGFSLVEMLVVVLIIGLMTGVAVLSLSLGQSHPLRDNAERLAELVREAGENASMQGQNLALGFWRHGWRFYVLREGGAWQPLSDDALLRARTLPQGLSLALELQGESVTLENHDKTKPQVFLLSSGEMQPFVVEISAPGHVAMRVRGNAIGEVRVQRVGDAEAAP
ncbi:type II secretion system minor pseudopilin GspH [Metallibacterium scheffleri]|jgi:general secretion pathway protein H|uniref:type II secretion system minor pseudopilin GspH n=1 Tax=Metallibacterium scheffleri TaxID=993689 RepID=UPI0023F34AEC|nr:type II secretion system minor pseudopilin GspH [Metallibacterium scheffleri]